MIRRRHMKLQAVLVVMLLISISILAACVGGTQQPTTQTVKIGNLTDLTGPGAPSILLKFRGESDYFSYLNDVQGGIEYKDPKTGKVAKVKIEHLWSDTRYQVPLGITAYKKFKEEGVVCLLTTVSGHTDALRDFVADDEIPMVTPAPGSDQNINPPGWIFLDRCTYADCYAGFLKWCKEQWKGEGSPKVATLVYDNPFGRGAITPATAEYARGIGVDIVASEFVEMMPVDTTTQLLRIRDAKADYVYMNMIAATCAAIMKDANRLGLADKITFVGGHNCYLDEVIALGGDVVEGVMGAMAYASWYEDVPGVNFAKELQNRYHGEITRAGAYFIPCALNPVIVEAIRLALNEVGFDALDGAAVKDALEGNIRDFDTGGLTGPITYTTQERRGNRFIKIGKIEGGKVVSISDWFESPDMLPK